MEGFPPDIGAVMRSHVPVEVEAFLETETNVLGQELQSIPGWRRAEVLAIFTHLGIACVDDTVLITKVLGAF